MSEREGNLAKRIIRVEVESSVRRVHQKNMIFALLSSSVVLLFLPFCGRSWCVVMPHRHAGGRCGPSGSRVNGITSTKMCLVLLLALRWNAVPIFSTAADLPCGEFESLLTSSATAAIPAVLDLSSYDGAVTLRGCKWPVSMTQSFGPVNITASAPAAASTGTAMSITIIDVWWEGSSMFVSVPSWVTKLDIMVQHSTIRCIRGSFNAPPALPTAGGKALVSSSVTTMTLAASFSGFALAVVALPDSLPNSSSNALLAVTILVEDSEITSNVTAAVASLLSTSVSSAALALLAKAPPSSSSSLSVTANFTLSNSNIAATATGPANSSLVVTASVVVEGWRQIMSSVIDLRNTTIVATSHRMLSSSLSSSLSPAKGSVAMASAVTFDATWVISDLTLSCHSSLIQSYVSAALMQGVSQAIGFISLRHRNVLVTIAEESHVNATAINSRQQSPLTGEATPEACAVRVVGSPFRSVGVPTFAQLGDGMEAEDAPGWIRVVDMVRINVSGGSSVVTLAHRQAATMSVKVDFPRNLSWLQASNWTGLLVCQLAMSVVASRASARAMSLSFSNEEARVMHIDASNSSRWPQLAFEKLSLLVSSSSQLSADHYTAASAMGLNWGLPDTAGAPQLRIERVRISVEKESSVDIGTRSWTSTAYLRVMALVGTGVPNAGRLNASFLSVTLSVDNSLIRVGDLSGGATSLLAIVPLNYANIIVSITDVVMTLTNRAELWIPESSSSASGLFANKLMQVDVTAANASDVSVHGLLIRVDASEVRAFVPRAATTRVLSCRCEAPIAAVLTARNISIAVQNGAQVLAAGSSESEALLIYTQASVGWSFVVATLTDVEIVMDKDVFVNVSSNRGQSLVASVFVQCQNEITANLSNISLAASNRAQLQVINGPNSNQFAGLLSLFAIGMSASVSLSNVSIVTSGESTGLLRRGVMDLAVASVVVRAYDTSVRVSDVTILIVDRAVIDVMSEGSKSLAATLYLEGSNVCMLTASRVDVTSADGTTVMSNCSVFDTGTTLALTAMVYVAPTRKASANITNITVNVSGSSTLAASSRSIAMSAGVVAVGDTATIRGSFLRCTAASLVKAEGGSRVSAMAIECVSGNCLIETADILVTSGSTIFVTLTRHLSDRDAPPWPLAYITAAGVLWEFNHGASWAATDVAIRVTDDSRLDLDCGNNKSAYAVCTGGAMHGSTEVTDTYSLQLNRAVVLLSTKSSILMRMKVIKHATLAIASFVLGSGPRTNSASLVPGLQLVVTDSNITVFQEGSATIAVDGIPGNGTIWASVLGVSAHSDENAAASAGWVANRQATTAVIRSSFSCDANCNANISLMGAGSSRGNVLSLDVSQSSLPSLRVANSSLSLTGESKVTVNAVFAVALSLVSRGAVTATVVSNSRIEVHRSTVDATSIVSEAVAMAPNSAALVSFPTAVALSVICDRSIFSPKVTFLPTTAGTNMSASYVIIMVTRSNVTASTRHEKTTSSSRECPTDSVIGSVQIWGAIATGRIDATNVDIVFRGRSRTFSTATGPRSTSTIGTIGRLERSQLVGIAYAANVSTSFPAFLPFVLTRNVRLVVGDGSVVVVQSSWIAAALVVALPSPAFTFVFDTAPVPGATTNVSVAAAYAAINASCLAFGCSCSVLSYMGTPSPLPSSTPRGTVAPTASTISWSAVNTTVVATTAGDDGSPLSAGAVSVLAMIPAPSDTTATQVADVAFRVCQSSIGIATAPGTSHRLLGTSEPVRELKSPLPLGQAVVDDCQIFSLGGATVMLSTSNRTCLCVGLMTSRVRVKDTQIVGDATCKNVGWLTSTPVAATSNVTWKGSALPAAAWFRAATADELASGPLSAGSEVIRCSLPEDIQEVLLGILPDQDVLDETTVTTTPSDSESVSLAGPTTMQAATNTIAGGPLTASNVPSATTTTISTSVGLSTSRDLPADATSPPSAPTLPLANASVTATPTTFVSPTTTSAMTVSPVSSPSFRAAVDTKAETMAAKSFSVVAMSSVVRLLAAPGDAMQNARTFAVLRAGTGRCAVNFTDEQLEADIGSRLAFPRALLPFAVVARSASATAVLGNVAAVALSLAVTFALATRNAQRMLADVTVDQPPPSPPRHDADDPSSVESRQQAPAAVKYDAWAKARFPCIGIGVALFVLDGTAFASTVCLLRWTDAFSNVLQQVGNGGAAASPGLVGASALLGSAFCAVVVVAAIATLVVNPLVFVVNPAAFGSTLSSLSNGGIQSPAMEKAASMLLFRRGEWTLPAGGRELELAGRDVELHSVRDATSSPSSRVVPPSAPPWHRRFRNLMRPLLMSVRGGQGIVGKLASLGVVVDVICTVACAVVEAIAMTIPCESAAHPTSKAVATANAAVSLVATVFFCMFAPHPSPVKAVCVALNGALGTAIAVLLLLAPPSGSESTTMATSALRLAMASAAVTAVCVGVSITTWVLRRKFVKRPREVVTDIADPRDLNQSLLRPPPARANPLAV